MTITITGEDALRLLKEVVAERGEDFVYEPVKKTDPLDPGQTCFYIKDGVPSCGVGLALSKFGVPNEVLERMDMDTDEAQEGTGITGPNSTQVLWEAGYMMEPSAQVLFLNFQASQDARNPYGESLQLAKERLAQAF